MLNLILIMTWNPAVHQDHRRTVLEAVKQRRCRPVDEAELLAEVLPSMIIEEERWSGEVQRRKTLEEIDLAREKYDAGSGEGGFGSEGEGEGEGGGAERGSEGGGDDVVMGEAA